MQLIVLFLVLTILGAASMVAGVFVLAGMGWSLVAGGAFLIGAAVFVRRGMTANG